MCTLFSFTNIFERALMLDACLHHERFAYTYLQRDTTRVWVVSVPTLHRSDDMVQNLGTQLTNGRSINSAWSPSSSSSSPIAIWVLNTLHSHLVGQPARMHPALLVAGGTSSSGTKCNLGRRLDPRTGYKLSCGVSLTLSVYVKRERECAFEVKGRSVRF